MAGIYVNPGYTLGFISQKYRILLKKTLASYHRIKRFPIFVFV